MQPQTLEDVKSLANQWGKNKPGYNNNMMTLLSDFVSSDAPRAERNKALAYLNEFWEGISCR